MYFGFCLWFNLHSHSFGCSLLECLCIMCLWFHFAVDNKLHTNLNFQQINTVGMQNISFTFCTAENKSTFQNPEWIINEISSIDKHVSIGWLVRWTNIFQQTNKIPQWFHYLRSQTMNNSIWIGVNVFGDSRRHCQLFFHLKKGIYYIYYLCIFGVDYHTNRYSAIFRAKNGFQNNPHSNRSNE